MLNSSRSAATSGNAPTSSQTFSRSAGEAIRASTPPVSDRFGSASIPSAATWLVRATAAAR